MRILKTGRPCIQIERVDLMRTAALTQLDFRSAAEAWLETRRHHLSPRTFLDYTNYIKTLAAFFGEMRLPEIDGDQIRAYQRSRRTRCGAGIINKECGVLIMMRQRIGMPIADYQRLKEPKDWESPGRRLTADEEERLEKECRAAANVPKWAVAGLTTLLSMKSGVGPGEMRHLRLKDCTLDPPQIIIPPKGAKNQRRQRIVPLNDAAAWALERLLDRAIDSCGSGQPDHYLIPFQNRDKTFDPCRPCSEDGWRTALNQLLGFAGIECRPYDFRHHAVSLAISNPQVTREGAKDYFGWIPDRMFRRYGHQELAALKVVAAAMDKKPVQISSYDPRKPVKRQSE
jgi:integrase